MLQRIERLVVDSRFLNGAAHQLTVILLHQLSVSFKVDVMVPNEYFIRTQLLLLFIAEVGNKVPFLFLRLYETGTAKHVLLNEHPTSTSILPHKFE